MTTGLRVGAFTPPTSLTTAPPAIRRITVPTEHPVTVTVYAAAAPTGAPITQPVAVPRFDRSLTRNPVTGTSNVTSNTRVVALVTLSLFEVPLSDVACRSSVGNGLVSKKVAVSCWALLDMKKVHGLVVPTQVVVPPLSNAPVQAQRR